MEWQDGRYAGKTVPAVRARTIVEPKLDEIISGTKLKIKMGKSAAAEVWNAVFLRKEDAAQTESDVPASSTSCSTGPVASSASCVTRAKVMKKKRSGISISLSQSYVCPLHEEPTGTN